MIKTNRIIFEHIKRRIDRNANALILVVGDVGSGKTWLGLNFSEDWGRFINTSFNVHWVGFEPRDILEIVLRDHPKGQPILLDEAGIFLSNRKSLTRSNIGLSFLLQTCRFLNHVILFTVPHMSFVDTVARKLFHYRIDVKPHFKNGVNSVMIRRVVQNTRYPDNPYYYPIPYKDGDGAIKYASHYYSRRPSKQLIDDYEAKRAEFIKNLYNQQKENLSQIENNPIREPAINLMRCPNCHNVINDAFDNCIYCNEVLKCQVK